MKIVPRCLLLGFVAAVAGCHRGQSAPRYLDLIEELPAAERRGAAPIDQTVFSDRTGGVDGTAPALVMRAPARVTYTTHFPLHAHLRSAVRLAAGADGRLGDGVTIRVGVSDQRIYEQLLSLAVKPQSGSAGAWLPVDVDLSSYAGWQWSLFYRPSEIDWHLILNADAAPSGAVAWSQPLVR